jgi:P-type E1-E2 ATPase
MRIAIIGFLQESKAVSAMEAMMQTMETQATVFRAGKQVRLNAALLVPGDVVLLQNGDKVPADMRLFDISTLRIDESVLRGESMPVSKKSDILESGLPWGRAGNDGGDICRRHTADSSPSDPLDKNKHLGLINWSKVIVFALVVYFLVEFEKRLWQRKKRRAL